MCAPLLRLQAVADTCLMELKETQCQKSYGMIAGHVNEGRAPILNDSLKCG